MWRAKLKDAILELPGSILKRYYGKEIPFDKMVDFLFLHYAPWLGSTLSVTPIFRAMKKIFPEGHITVVCDEMGYQVFKHNPNIDKIWVSPSPEKNLLGAILFFLKLRRRKLGYDCVITAEGRFRMFFLEALTGARCRVGFEDPNNFFCNVTIPRSPDASVIENHLRLLTAFDESSVAVGREPEIHFSQEEMLFVENLFDRKKVDKTKLMIAIQTQSRGGKPNRWGGERFVRLADEIVKEFDATVVFTGAKWEARNIERIRTKMTCPSISVAGETDVPQLAALLRRCDLLVTLDTGTMHVGWAIGVPMVIIASANVPLHQWLPIGAEKHVILVKDSLPCAACFKDSCSSNECMTQITPEEVFEAVRFQVGRSAIEKVKNSTETGLGSL